jgi:hypothetical protein
MDNKSSKFSKDLYIDNGYVELWIEDGIVMEILKPTTTYIDLSTAKKIVEDRLTLSNGITMPIFIDSGNIKNMEKDAREYFVTPESMKYISASALLINNYAAWLGGKLFLTFNKPAFTTELFRSKQKAIAWLQHYKNLN